MDLGLKKAVEGDMVSDNESVVSNAQSEGPSVNMDKKYKADEKAKYTKINLQGLMSPMEGDIPHSDEHEMVGIVHNAHGAYLREVNMYNGRNFQHKYS